MKYEIEDIIPELIEVKFVLECSSGIRYLPAAHGRQVNGARKLRFERMTPIRKAREKTKVGATQA